MAKIKAIFSFMKKEIAVDVCKFVQYIQLKFSPLLQDKDEVLSTYDMYEYAIKFEE